MPSVALAQTGAPLPDSDSQSSTDPFVTALAAARAGDLSAAADPPEIRTHPLYAYLEAARIAYRLSQAEGPDSDADASAAVFLRRNAGLPVARWLRYDWAVSLARREQWQSFLQQYDETFADQRLHCQSLEARIALDRTEGIVPAIVARWLTPRQLPGECEPVFQWLHDEGALTEDLVEQRVRMLLENGQSGFARVIARRLSDERAAPLLRWAALIERPARELEQLVSEPEDIESDALLDAWARLSRDDPENALRLYEPLLGTVESNSELVRSVHLALALGLAWDRRPEALAVFAAIPDDELDDYALGWRTRAALWAGDWALADAGIEAMSPLQRDQSMWRYWAGRVTEERVGRREARTHYETLLDDDNFYAGLAAAQLRRRLRPTLEPLPRHDATLATLARNPALIRASALFEIGLPVAALREWRFGVADLDDERDRQAIHLAADWQRYDLAVATATRLGIFNDYPLLYPTPYRDAVVAATRETGLQRELVYGVMRQESLFRADAVSSAGAHGLMQLKPGTAARYEPEVGTRLSNDDLLDPVLNVRLGSAELARLIDEFQGRLPVALAAYNAGPNAAERWLPDEQMDADIWIENIPFNETRAYVRRVFWHSLVFRWLASRRAQDTRDWLERI
jgi:soluble lytic murein transglycosylase